MKYAAIVDWAGDKQYPVTFMCAQLGATRQGYYAHAVFSRLLSDTLAARQFNSLAIVSRTASTSPSS